MLILLILYRFTVGNFQISLPFTVANSTDTASVAGGSVVMDGVVNANVSDFLIRAYENESVAKVFLGDATTLQSDSAQQLQTNTSISIGLTYFTD